MSTDCIRHGYRRIALKYSSFHESALAHTWKGADKEESISPSIKIVNSKASIGFGRTQNKTHQTRNEK
jgi:hypothetical protein